MQFGLTTLLAALTAVTTVSAQVYSGYILNAVPDPKGPALKSYWTTVSFYNGTLYIGEAKMDYSSELFLFSKGDLGPSSIAFTSYHGVPTGWQNMYVYPEDMRAPGFTSPHSAFIPPGADAYNFTIGLTDDKFRYKKTNRWHACPSTDPSKQNYYQIIYVGGSHKAPKECTAVALKASKYGSCPTVDPKV